MALRLHRVTEEQWQRLAASRREQEFTSPPERTAINAIEVELQSLQPRTD